MTVTQPPAAKLFTVDDVLEACKQIDLTRRNERWTVTSESLDRMPLTYQLMPLTYQLIGPGNGGGRCRYANPADLTRPSCLVGTIVSILSPELFVAMADSDMRIQAVDNIYNHFEPTAVTFLGAAQGEADFNASWGDSIDHARVQVLS